MSAASVDRFRCRREGHVPSIRVTRQNAVTDKPFKYLTSCQRCGKVYEETMDDAGA